MTNIIFKGSLYRDKLEKIFTLCLQGKDSKITHSFRYIQDTKSKKEVLQFDGFALVCNQDGLHLTDMHGNIFLSWKNIVPIVNWFNGWFWLQQALKNKLQYRYILTSQQLKKENNNSTHECYYLSQVLQEEGQFITKYPQLPHPLDYTYIIEDYEGFHNHCPLWHDFEIDIYNKIIKLLRYENYDSDSDTEKWELIGDCFRWELENIERKKPTILIASVLQGEYPVK